MLKELSLNIYLLKDLEQIARYMIFMKDFIKKRKPISCEDVGGLHYYSAITVQSLMQKKGDPRSLMIPYTIGTYRFVSALYDLGSSINLMPLEVLK